MTPLQLRAHLLRLKEKAGRIYAAGVRRATARGQTEFCTLEEFRCWFMDHWGAPCAECSGRGDQVDHVIPLAKGGAHKIDNLQFLCGRCNATKSHWLPGEKREYSFKSTPKDRILHG